MAIRRTSKGGRTSRRHFTWYAISLGIALVAVVSIFITGTALDPTDQIAIQKVIRGALVARQTLEVPPANVTNGKLPDNVRASMHLSVRAAIDLYYAPGPTHDYLIQALSRNIDSDADGAHRYMGGGVDWVKYDLVQIDGNSADVSASAQVWNRQLFTSPSGQQFASHPVSVIAYSAHLVKDAVGWQIETDNLSIVSGARP